MLPEKKITLNFVFVWIDARITHTIRIWFTFPLIIDSQPCLYICARVCICICVLSIFVPKQSPHIDVSCCLLGLISAFVLLLADFFFYDGDQFIVAVIIYVPISYMYSALSSNRSVRYKNVFHSNSTNSTKQQQHTCQATNTIQCNDVRKRGPVRRSPLYLFACNGVYIV